MKLVCAVSMKIVLEEFSLLSWTPKGVRSFGRSSDVVNLHKTLGIFSFSKKQGLIETIQFIGVYFKSA